jgi:hypothetical protein
MKSAKDCYQAIAVLTGLAIGVLVGQPIARGQESEKDAVILRRVPARSIEQRGEKKEIGKRHVAQVEPQQVYDYYIQADSHPDNTMEVMFVFTKNPGRVDFSISPACGTLNPSYADPVSCDGDYCVSTWYTPCETECSYVTVTADPATGPSQSTEVHLDDRQHIWCCSESWERELGVGTYDVNTSDCNEAFVTVTVIPPEAGNVSPSSGNSYWDSDYECYVFFSTYAPSCSYSGRARVKFHTSGSDVIYSFEQNTLLTPSSGWQTVSDSFCSEGWWLNYYEVYKMYLTAGKRYNFSLCANDGVGAACSGDGDLTMYNSACLPKWYIDGDEGCGFDASTIGTIYEDWSPPSNGYYYLEVMDYSGDPMSYTLAYKEDEDASPPSPNPMTWAMEPYDVSTSSLSMVATTATDPSTPISYYFEFVDSPTGGTGGTGSSWQLSTTYTDTGLSANHRYGYKVKAKDGVNNETSYSSPVRYEYTDIQASSGVIFGAVTSSSIEVKSSNSPSNLPLGSSGLIIRNLTNGTDSGWKQNNNYWISSGLSPNTEYEFTAQSRNGDGDETPESSPLSQWTLQCNVPGDFEPDCDVDTDDLKVLCDEWLSVILSWDVWPEGGDGFVDFLDYSVFADGWQTTYDYDDLADFTEEWLERRITVADIAPDGGDGIVNMLDYAVLAENWLAGL